jgi:CubicO group peptidase (beta-lactamase class C family)
MKRNHSSKYLIIPLITLAMLTPAILLSAGAQASDCSVAPVNPPDRVHSSLSIRGLSWQTGAPLQTTETDVRWPESVAGFTFARHFTVFDKYYLTLLSAKAGILSTCRIDAKGKLGRVVDSFTSPKLRCTSADFVKVAGKPYLILLDSFSGTIRTYRMKDDGTVDRTTLTEDQLSDWQDKNILSPYIYAGQVYLLGVNTWTGNAVVYAINGTKVDEAQWSRGWTSIDHITVGETTYRLLYKAVGDPQRESWEDGDQRGRLVIQRLSGNGFTGPNTYDMNSDADWSTVKFIEYWNQDETRYAVFGYNRGTGACKTQLFSPVIGSLFIQFEDQIEAGWTDIEPYTMQTDHYMITLNEEGVTPFLLSQAEKMGEVIHEEMEDKAVGYQFMLAQSGHLLYSRAYGMAKLGADADYPLADLLPHEMTTRTRLDLGSVSKMITAMTLLKLVSNGRLNLCDQISRYLDPAQYADDSWVKRMTIRDLLTHTTGMQYEDEGNDQCVTNPTTLEENCLPFFSSSQTVALHNDGTAPDGYERAYNNSNIVAVRKVIEYLEGITTSPEIVEKTGELWADSLGFQGLSCQHDPDVFYFARFQGGDKMFPFNGKNWRQDKIVPNWSSNCAAGAWAASSRQMIEFLLAVRYQKVLSAQINDLFLDTGLVDGNGDPTALSWEPPWDAMPGKATDWQLGKDGYKPQNGVATRAYITRLPNSMDAVLLVNTDVPETGGLVRGAYLYAAGLADKPNYTQIAPVGSEEEEAGNGEIDRLAISTTSLAETHPVATNVHYVTAARRSNNQLKLTGWYVQPDGQVQREGHAFASGTIKDVAITDGEAFVTAVSDSNDNLKLSSWTVSGDDITGHATVQGGKVSKIAVTKLAGTGLQQGRIATAMCTPAGNLQVGVWDFDNLAPSITSKDTYQIKSDSEVAVKTLSYGNDLNSTTRFATVVRGSRRGAAQVDLWEVSPQGKLTRKATWTSEYQMSDEPSFKKKLALGEWGNGNIFVAYIKTSGKLEVTTLEVVNNSELQEKGEAEGLEKTEVAITGTATVLRNSDGNLQIINWRISSDGSITDSGSADAGAVNLVAAAGKVLAAMSLGDNGQLKLINWDVVN